MDGDFMAVDRARVIEADNNAWVEVALHEGKQHEVKRLLEAVGHPVSKLRRVSFGPVTAKGLEPGQFRALTAGRRSRACGAGEGSPARARTRAARPGEAGLRGRGTRTDAAAPRRQRRARRGAGRARRGAPPRGGRR